MTRSRALSGAWLPVALSLLHACDATPARHPAPSPAERPTPPPDAGVAPRPTPPAAPPAPDEPPDAGAASAVTTSGDCVVELRVTVESPSATDRTLRVVARNRTGEPVAFVMPDRCPNGLVELEGLGSGYDYYGSCTAGACVKRGDLVPIVLPAHGQRALADTTVSLTGRAPCTGPLAPGRYAIRPVLPPAPFPLCATAAIVEVPPPGPDAPRAPLGPAPTTRATPPAEAPAAECSSAADCVLSCPSAPGCCGFPCGCRNAIPRSKQAAFERDYPKSCRKAPCPAMGCAYQPAFGATCRAGRCVPVSSPADF